MINLNIRKLRSNWKIVVKECKILRNKNKKSKCFYHNKINCWKKKDKNNKNLIYKIL